MQHHSKHGSQKVKMTPNSTPQERRFPTLHVALPEWVDALLADPLAVFATVEERMQLAIDLSRLNVEQGTGGPFGAAIFDIETHRLIAPGVNLVVASKWSGAHAEMVAVALAQQVAESHDLGGTGLARHELVTSTEPCSMCFGATPWSGVQRLVCAANEQDARAIGFDEGPKPVDWVRTLETRGIEVVQDVLRSDAAAILQSYANSGGAIYNGRGGNSRERTP